MAFKITIDGVDKTSSISVDAGASISMPLNGRATMRFTCLPGYVPDKRDEVIAYEQDGVTKLFGGVVVQRRARSGVYGTTPMWTECECGDFSTYADWCYQTKTYTTTKTLKEVLTDLVNDKLDDYGIALDAGQVNGPNLSAFAWEDKRVSDCLRELADKTGYVYRIDADKKLKMFVPGTDAAPFSVTDATPNVEDIRWDDSTETPANKVTLRCGPDGVGSEAITHTWTADSGVTTVFALDGENVPASSTWPGSVLVNAVSYPIWPPGDAPGGNGIEWDYETNSGTLSFLGTSTSLIAGTESIVLTYYPQYPFVVSDATGATPIVEKVYRFTDVTTYAAAVQLAAGLSDQVAQEPRTLVMPSLEDGCAPGDSLTVNVTSRSFNATTTITQVDIDLITSGFWRYTLTAQEATVIQADYLGQWRQLTSSGGSSGVSSATVTVVSGTGVTGTGTTGKLMKWLSSSVATDSIVSESGSALTVAGSVEATAMTIGGAYVYRVGGTDVAVADGGTGLSSYATGDVLYASAATTLAKLGIGATEGMFLRRTSGGLPGWSTLILPNSITSGYVPYATGTNTIGSGSGLTYNGSAFAVTGTGRFSGTVGIGIDPSAAISVFAYTTTLDFGVVAQVVRTSGNSVGFQAQASGAGSGTRTGLVATATDGPTNYAIRTLSLSPPAGANNWAIHSASEAQSYFAGSVGVGVTAPSAKLHVIHTSEQLRLGYDASNYYTTTVSSAGAVTFNAVGASAGFTFSDGVTVSGSLVVSDVASHLVPSATDTYDLGSATRLWRSSYISTMNAVVFAETTQTLFGGYSTIGHDAGSLNAAVTSGATTIDFGDTMTPGDFVLIRAHDTGGTIKAEYIEIGTLVSGTTYNVTRDKAAAHGTDPAWAAGTPFLVLGQSGDGRIDMVAVDGKPRIVFTTQGATYNAQSDRAVIGNLNTYFGYASDLFGAAFGDPSNAWIKIDPTNGVRIGHNATTKISLTAAGDASFAGSITATGGTIGGWTITSQQLSAGSGASFVGLNSTAGTVRLWAGGETATTAPWRVTEAGVMTAIGATIQTVSGTGARVELTAAGLKGYDATTMRFSVLTDGSGTLGTNGIAWTTAGVVTLGGWTVASTRLSSGSGASYVALDGSAGTIRLWAGNETAASAPFRVTEAGALTATSATITGAITATSGSITGDFTIGTAGLLRSGATDYATGTGWVLDYNGGTPRFRVGTTAGNRFVWDGTNLKVVSSSVTIDDDGVLVAPATDVIGETGGYRFDAGTTWGLYGMNGDGPINTYLRTVNGQNDATAHANIQITAEVTHASAVATVTVTSDVVTMTADETSISGALALPGTSSPAQLTANQNNWSLSTTVRFFRISADAARDVTGIVAMDDGTEIVLWNGAANTITLKHESASSTAGNRFLGPGAADFALTQYKTVWLRYSSTDSRWVILG